MQVQYSIGTVKEACTAVYWYCKVYKTVKYSTVQ